MPQLDWPDAWSVTSRRARIRPVRISDVGRLGEILSDQRVVRTWRDPTGVVQGEDLWTYLYSFGNLSMAVEIPGRSECVGLVQIYGMDTRCGTASLACFTEPKVWRLGVAAEAIACLSNLMFDEFGLRKLYLECPASVFKTFASAEGRLFYREGQFRDRWLRDGDVEDIFVLAIWSHMRDIHGWWSVSTAG